MCMPVLLGLLFIFAGCTNGKKQRADANSPEASGQAKNLKQEKPLPELVLLNGKVRDVGRVKEGLKVHVTFTLVNKGKAKASDISVHDQSRGGCTAVSKVSQLAPGDTARLEFIFETLGYGGKKQDRKITLRYNNPELSPVTLRVKGEVIPAPDYQVPIGELYYNFFVLVDVRSPQEFRKGHIAGAVNVPAGELMAWASQLPDNFLIYLYSDTGAQSDTLARQLQAKGFSRAQSIVGGLQEWIRRYDRRVIIEGQQ